jgi:hypothetical protein
MQKELLGIIGVGFDVTDQLMIRFVAFVIYGTTNGSTVTECFRQLYTSRKPRILFTREVLFIALSLVYP